MTRAQVLAFLAGGLGVFSLWEILAVAERTQISSRLSAVLLPLRRARSEGRDPTKLERFRLVLLTSLSLLVAGSLAGGILLGVLLSLTGPTLVMFVVRTRRRRYVSELSRGAPSAARAMADALSGGHSIPSALEHSVAGTTGAVANELSIAVNAFRLGEPTEVSLHKLGQRASCQRWNTIVAATLLNRQAGGNLAELLTQLAGAFEGADRIEKDARSVTAQARFTAWLVLGLPVGAAVLMQLGDSSFLQGLAGNPISLILTALSLALQMFALVCVRRVSRPFSQRVQ